jgi:hypothetical protein
MRSITTPTTAIAVLVIATTLLAYPSASDAVRLTADGAKLEMAATSDDARSDTGIAGQVIIRPVRPHETAGMPNLNPYQATVQVLDPSGQPVTIFRSDAAGNFRVVLPPGQYVLQPQSPGLYPRASEQTVVVSPNGFTQVRIIYDSGMR